MLPDPSYLASCAQAGVDPNQPSPDMFFTVSHQIAGDLNNVDDDVVRWDPPDQYTYFVELLGPDETPLDAQPIPVPGQHLMCVLQLLLMDLSLGSPDVAPSSQARPNHLHQDLR